MQVLLIHQAFATMDEPGGTRHHELARQLAIAGYKVTVITGKVSYLTGQAASSGLQVVAEVDDCGVEILRVPSYAKWHRSFLHRLVGFFSFMLVCIIVGLRRKQVDVVWGTTPPLFQGIAAWIVARLKGAAFLFEVRDLWPKFAIALGVLRNRVLINLSQWLERFLYRKADAIMINSPGFREHVVERGGREVVLVPNGVDMDMFPEGTSPNELWDDPMLTGKFVVLYAGAHGEANDLGVVLEAASKLLDAGEIRFVLVGDGKEKGTLVGQAEEQGLENVIFYPPVSKKEIAGVLSNADVCLAILKPLDAFKTTYPNKVFDYMAAEKPIILAIDGVIREVVEGAGAGLFVPPGDAQALADTVKYLWQNPSEGIQMGQAGRKHVSAHFDRSKQVEALDALIHGLQS